MTKEQQTENLLKLFEVSFSKKQLGLRIPPYWPDYHEKHMEYAVRFERLKPREGEPNVLTFLWYASLAEPNKCTAFDVLVSCSKDIFSSFEEWADCYGRTFNYSRRLYQAIQQEAKEINAFFCRENEMNIILKLDY